MSSLIGALCTVVLARVGVLAGSGPDAAAGITTIYVGAAYTYDASSSSSTQDVAAPSPRGSPATLPAASWEDPVPLGRFEDGANTARAESFVAELFVAESRTYVGLTRGGSTRNVGQTRRIPSSLRP